ncbi:hypothetical protein [Streptomyces sp. TR06-5]
MAKRVLLAQALLAGGIVVTIVLRELPGLAREIKIWRMAGNSSGVRAAA